MAELRFDNRVAVITGAGRGLGRSYALLLAARGAKVVVNDPGVTMQGDTSDEGPAQAVVSEITAAGGEAVVDTNSVATQEGGQAIIASALDTWGRIDILIHNAGIVRKGPIRELSHDDWHAVLDVHLHGGFHVLRPAMPAMCDAGYGRIVMTASINALYGNTGVANYSVAKAGLVALATAAALEGAEHGVKSNAIVPAAVTRLSAGIDTSAFPPMPPDLVAPAVAYLAHESCAMTGEMLISAAGRVARAYIAESPGVFLPDGTIEDIARNIEAIRSTADPVIFPAVPSGHLDHLRYSFEMARSG